VRASGTVVSATVSLGYDNPHGQIERLLIEAADGAGLQDAFVQITELSDFSVTYRVAGFLPEVKQILTARSNLRAMMLDTLHTGGVEIVSPTFMNQRPIADGTRAVPPHQTSRLGRIVGAKDSIPEDLIFDKAEQAERLEQFRAVQEQIAGEIKELEAAPQLERKLERRRKRIEAIAGIIDSYREDDDPSQKEKRKRSRKKNADSQ